jgi:hypothetical protein
VPGLTEESRIYYQARAQVFVCSQPRCDHGLLKEEVESHLKNRHNIFLTPEARKTLYLCELYVSPPTDMHNSPDPVAPFQGIRMTLGMVCNLCLYACPEKESMRKHFSRCHKSRGTLFSFFFVIPAHEPVLNVLG